MKTSPAVRTLAAAVLASVLVIGCSTNDPVGPGGPAAPGAAAFSPAGSGVGGGTEGLGTSRLRGRLASTARDPLASGTAKWEKRSDRVKFSTEVEDVSTGGKHMVTVNGLEVGNIIVTNGFGDLNLDSRLGHKVPLLTIGDKVEVYNPAGERILTGIVR